VPDPFGASVARRQDVDLNGHSASSNEFSPVMVAQTMR
jgi:hypothetical protein